MANGPDGLTEGRNDPEQRSRQVPAARVKPAPSVSDALGDVDHMSDLSNHAILQVTPALDSGGAEQTTLEIVHGIVNAGARALVASRGGRLSTPIEAAGGKFIPMPAESKNPIKIFLNAFALAKIVRRDGVDIIHARSRAPAWSALWAARMTGAKFVTTYHGAYRARFAFKRLYNSVMARGDLVIANSTFTAQQINAAYTRSPRRMAVIPRGVDVHAFSPDRVDAARRSALADKWGLADRGTLPGEEPPTIEDTRPPGLIVLLPARVTSWKGHDIAVKAIAHLLSQPRATGALGDDGVLSNSRAQSAIAAGAAANLTVVFCGDRQGRQSFADHIDADIKARGLTDMFRWVGHCDDMPAAYALADLVLAPSTRPEAFGRTAVEAAAMGKIVIAADHGGARETVDDGRTGVLCAPGDVVGLAEAMAAVMAMTPAERHRIGAQARRRVAAQFSTGAMVRSTLRAYSDLLESD